MGRKLFDEILGILDKPSNNTPRDGWSREKTALFVASLKEKLLTSDNDLERSKILLSHFPCPSIVRDSPFTNGVGLWVLACEPGLTKTMDEHGKPNIRGVMEMWNKELQREHGYILSSEKVEEAIAEFDGLLQSVNPTVSSHRYLLQVLKDLEVGALHQEK